MMSPNKVTAKVFDKKFYKDVVTNIKNGGVTVTEAIKQGTKKKLRMR